MDPGEIIPSEMWELVFDKVEDPQDWLNLYLSSSSYFHQVVGEKRTTVLFAQVLPHVSEYLGGKDIADILVLRLVGRFCKTAVENLLEENVESSSCGVQILRRQLRKPYDFKNSVRMSSFLAHFGTHSGNPFVGRWAHFHYDYRQRSQVISRYNRLATLVMNKFGAGLKTLRVRFEEAIFDDAATRLQSCIQRAPNLESLDVQCINTGNIVLRRPGDELLSFPFIEQKPFPTLPNLKLMSFSGPGKRVVLRNLQSTMVRLARNSNSLMSVQTVGFPAELSPCPNVTSAQVYLETVEDCFFNLPSTPSWPLSSLTLTYTTYAVPIHRIYECAQHFKATLTSLHLRNPLFERRNSGLTLDLPRLKQLTIAGYLGMSLEFLAGLNSLEHLSVTNHLPRASHNDEAESLQQFIGCVQAEVVRSRLWETLPKLTKVFLIEPNAAAAAGEESTFLEVGHVATRERRQFRQL